jgi:hypothetical protein
MEPIYAITREENWGTRLPRKYHTVYIMASGKNQAIARLNKHIRLGNSDCLKISDKPLTQKLSDLHDMFRVEEIEILDELP